MTKKFTQLFWMDAIDDLARRIEVPATVQRQLPNTGTLLYILPTTLAEVCAIYGATGGRVEYKCVRAVIDGSAQWGFRDLRKVDLAEAFRAFRRAKASTTIRALAYAYDHPAEIDILLIEPAYLADPKPAIDQDKQHRVIP